MCECEGYKDVVVHVSLLEVVHNGVLVDLGEEHHVVHSTLLDIVALPVVPVVAPGSPGTHRIQYTSVSAFKRVAPSDY